MAFIINLVQQITMDDGTFQLTARERRALERSCAKVFSDEIFPNIEAEPFRVLYCEKTGDRTPPREYHSLRI